MGRWPFGLAVITIALIVLAIPITAWRKGDTLGGLDAAGVVLLSGAVALAIERTIEFIWMAVGLMKKFVLAPDGGSRLRHRSDRRIG